MMTLDEAKEVFINRGYVPTNDGKNTIYDPDKWRNSVAVISRWLEHQELEQEPCEDAISREDTLARLRADTSFICTGDKLQAIEIVNNMPSVNLQPKTGHWIPNLMHKEMGIPLIECKKAYDLAIEYLRDKARVKG